MLPVTGAASSESPAKIYDAATVLMVISVKVTSVSEVVASKLNPATLKSPPVSINTTSNDPLLPALAEAGVIEKTRSARAAPVPTTHATAHAAVSHTRFSRIECILSPPQSRSFRAGSSRCAELQFARPGHLQPRRRSCRPTDCRAGRAPDSPTLHLAH